MSRSNSTPKSPRAATNRNAFPDMLKVPDRVPTEREVVLAKIAGWRIPQNIDGGAPNTELGPANVEDAIPVANTWLPDRELDPILKKILTLKDMRDLPALIEPVRDILRETSTGRTYYDAFRTALAQEQQVSALRTIANYLGSLPPGNVPNVDSFIYEVGKLYDRDQLDALAQQLLDSLMESGPLPEKIDKGIAHYRAAGSLLFGKQKALKQLATYLQDIRATKRERSGPGFLTGGSRRRTGRKKLRGRRRRSIRRRC